MSSFIQTIMRSRIATLVSCLALLAILSEVATAGEPAPRPINPGGDYVYPTDSQYIPDKQSHYKIVFNLTKGVDDYTKINPSLNRVARTVNLYVASGVPLENLTLVAVVSSDAAPLVLAEEQYRKHFGVSNPNLALIDQLQRAGVKLTVCAQSVDGKPYPRDAVYPPVGVALSALTTVTLLQQQGFALLQL